MAQAKLTPIQTRRAPRVMLYSHDTFGLGHLRRSRLLATSITAADPTASALILTGSPVAGRFTFPRGVDHIRLPGVTKLADGSYASATMGTDIETTTNLRAGLIQSAAEQFDPDLLIVDKEPTGFRGELLPTLEELLARGKTKLVLGLREVLDAPDVLAAEWERKGSVAATERFYHDIWIYGLQSIYDPTQGLPFSPAVRARMHWTGYLRRTVPDDVTAPDEPYILVTPGGGGDGEVLVDLVLQAYEKDPELGPPAKFVYGPFLSGDTRRAFEARVEKLDGRVTTVGFESEMEALLSGAQGVICMGGYNTFCEVLSFDKPAVILPRRVPRLEQYIRASKAEELGLCRMLDEERDGLTADAMIAAIAALPDQRPPSAAFVDGLLDGLETVNERVRALLSDRSSCAAE
ncbi:glycosyltransferase family protein [Aestuariivita boseongensis]|uniref:glycosyltransferase family protein n=1 Tax=Aestuariivita boseongensis TaxID=1470562 RepID=UPI000B0D58D7|nr:glycosyltransferase [Aestuariivita boseongensis]